VPESFSPWYTTGGDDSGKNSGESKGTPGFELLTLIATLAIAFIMLKRKH